MSKKTPLLTKRLALATVCIFSIAGRALATEPAAEEKLEVEGKDEGLLPKAKIRYTLEGIEVRGNAKTTDRTILRYVPFRASDVLDVEDPELELSRYRLLSTGFFSSVEVLLRRGSHRGAAVLVIEVKERNTLIVQNLSVGIAADEDREGHSKPLSAFLGVEAAERNFLGTGILLGAGIGLAEDQLALRARFSDPAFLGTTWSATTGVLYSQTRDVFGNRDVLFESRLSDQLTLTDYAVVSTKRLGGSLGIGHDLGLLTQFSLQYRFERLSSVVPLFASHVRGNRREPIDFDILDGRSTLSVVSSGLSYDSRDAVFLPSRGTLAIASVTFGAPPFGSDYGFQKLELSADRWFHLPWKHVTKLSAFAGAMNGSAPYFEKFYVGDFTDLLPHRVLDLAPDRRQPPNYLGTNIVEVRYGDYAARLQGEYRIPIYRGSGRGSVFGIDFFATAGFYAVATEREFSDPAGYDGFAKIPVDLTYNLGLQVDTFVGGATIAFSNALGLLPGRYGARQ